MGKNVSIVPDGMEKISGEVYSSRAKINMGSISGIHVGRAKVAAGRQICCSRRADHRRFSFGLTVTQGLLSVHQGSTMVELRLSWVLTPSVVVERSLQVARLDLR